MVEVLLVLGLIIAAIVYWNDKYTKNLEEKRAIQKRLDELEDRTGGRSWEPL